MKSIILTATMLACLSMVQISALPAFAEDDITFKTIPTDDPEMAAAAAKAHQGLDGFLAKLDNPPAGSTNYAVKIGIVDKDGGFEIANDQSTSDVEYFWLGDIEHKADGFSATINNDPAIVKNIAIGQRIDFTKNDIFDWMYFKDEKIVGNVTACPLLRKSSAEERAYWRDNYGLDCEG